MARNGRMDVTADYEANEMSPAERAQARAFNAAYDAYWQGRHLQAVADGDPQALRNDWESQVEKIEGYSGYPFRDAQSRLMSSHPAFGLAAGTDVAQLRQMVAQAETVLTRMLDLHCAPAGYRVAGVI